MSQNFSFPTTNVRTLLDNNSDKRPERRTVLLAAELKIYDIANEGQITEVKAGYAFFCKGRTEEE